MVTQAEVSRRQAKVIPAQAGYVLTDLSTNGVFVNGDRVKYSVLLGRGDVIRLGSEEFRFDADAARRPDDRGSRAAGSREGAGPASVSPRALWVAAVILAAVGAAAFLMLG